MKVALEIHGPFGLHLWAINEKVEIKRLRVLSPSSNYCNTVESGDDGNNIWLVLAGTLTCLRGDADCSIVDFFFFAICYHRVMMGVLTPEIFLVSGEVLLSAQLKFSIDRSLFCLLVFRQGVSSPAPTSILRHGKYINKNFPELLTGCCAQAINF